MPMKDGGQSSLSHASDSAQAVVPCRYRVVVRTVTGNAIKGFITCQSVSANPEPIPPLPTVLDIHDEFADTVKHIHLSEVKAVFFVGTHEGDGSYQEVKFFREKMPNNLWVKASLVDGEAVEGITENSLRLLAQPGFWLWPSDRLANNQVIYIPKSSVKEFHVMGLTRTRPRHEPERDTGARI
jgi:Family of unknown function (DUF6982)